MKVAKVNFKDTIGSADFFWGTALDEVRYEVEGYSAFDSATPPQFPETVELHFWKCYGGDVYEGYAIYNYLRSVAKQGVVVKCYIHGLCASIATLIALAADEVYMAEAALYMVHKPMLDAGMMANADDHRKAAEILDKIQAQLVGIYTKKGGITPEAAHALLNQESYLTADECIAHGFVTAKLTDELLIAPVAAGKALNYFKPQNPQNMAITPAEETRLIDKFINAAKNVFAPRNETPAAPANMAVTLADGTSVYVDAAGDDVAQGDMVYTDEAMTTAAADGDYSLEDGRTISVAAGAITAITEATNDAPAPATNTADLDAATARIAELERELGVTTNKLTLATNKLKAVPGSTGNPVPAGTQAPGNKAANATADAATSRLSVVRR